MNKRTFDLIVITFVGLSGVMAGVRMWSHRYLMEEQGGLTGVAKVAKVVTG